MLVVRVTIFVRHTTKQNVMKKAKYLIFDRLERNCFEKCNTEKQHSPRIGSISPQSWLFNINSSKK